MRDTASSKTAGAFAPPQFSEVVLKTSRFAEVKEWYETVLDVRAFFVRTDVKKASWTGAHNVAFIRLYLMYPYTQVLGIFEIPAVAGYADGQNGGPGMHHMQFRCASLEHLFLRYEALRPLGFTPERAYNHGPGTSFYYRDPDRNFVEMSAVNFATEAEYLAYYRSDTYRRNISGIEIDPEEYVARFRAGTSQEQLVRIEA
jgi:catechol 2,3-dioxygenase-like lactoylglutathione lyase family enzyme